MEQAVQIFGALLVLAAFVATQTGFRDARSYPSLVLNLVGSGILAVLAAADRQWGFLLLEGVWAMVSLWSLAARLRSGESAPGARSTGAGVAVTAPDRREP